jgi:hypothetical protein
MPYKRCYLCTMACKFVSTVPVRGAKVYTWNSFLLPMKYTVKNAVELLDVPPRINSLMMKNYNSHVEILFSYTHVLFFQFYYRMRKFDIRTV